MYVCMLRIYELFFLFFFFLFFLFRLLGKATKSRSAHGVRERERKMKKICQEEQKKGIKQSLRIDLFL